MKALDDIGSVHYPADILIILKITAEARPVLLPGFYDLGITGTPISR